MTTSAPSVAPVTAAGVTAAERLALAGYSGLNRQAFELDLRQFASRSGQHGLPVFQARHPDIECFAWDLEASGRARATVTRRLCTIAGFYRYAVEDELLEHSPAHVRRPGWTMSRTPPAWTATNSALCAAVVAPTQASTGEDFVIGCVMTAAAIPGGSTCCLWPACRLPEAASVCVP